MITCKVTIKIKDYFPKIDTIPYGNYICLFTCGENEGQIPFLPDDSQIIQHHIKNVTSDIKYKVHILDYNDMSLIGMCEMTISYEIINQIYPPNGFFQDQQKKVLIDLKTKRKLFGTIVNLGDIYLNLYAEVFLISRTNIEQKNNNKIRKNFYQNTPQCYIKYNFQLNQSDFSPKSSKNKSSLINSNSEKHTLHNNHQEKCFTNKHSNYNLINYKTNKDKENNNNDDNNKKTYSNFNNNMKKGFKNYSSIIQQKKKSNNNVLKEQNRKNIMDLLQHKKMMEKKLEKENLEKDAKKEINSIENNNDNDNIIKKEGYLTDQNFNPQNGINLEKKYIINNHKLKKQNKEYALIYNKSNKMAKDGFKKSDNQINNKYIKYNLSDEHNLINKNNINNNNIKQNDNLYNNDIKNTLSPNVNNIFNNKENEFIKNISKTVKNSNVPKNINNQYVYQSKNKIVKMGKTLTKNKFNAKNNNDNLNQNKKYFTNTENNKLDKNINNKTKKDNNINTTLLSTYSYGEDDYYDIDRIIIEKGAELRNDFHMLLNQKTINNNFIHHNRNINTINNYKFNNQINKEENSQTNSELQNINEYSNNYQKNDSNNGIFGGTHLNIDTPMTDTISKYSSSQSLNSALTQETLKIIV